MSSRTSTSSASTDSSSKTYFFEQSSSVHDDAESAEKVVNQAILNFFTNENYNSALKCTFRRSETTPAKFNVLVNIKPIDEKVKRHMIVENCFDHCNCLQQLVELRRQKRNANAFHQISMQYGGESSFQRPNLEKHIRHVRSRDKSSNESKRTSTTNSSKK